MWDAHDSSPLWNAAEAGPPLHSRRTPCKRTHDPLHSLRIPCRPTRGFISRVSTPAVEWLSGLVFLGPLPMDKNHVLVL